MAGRSAQAPELIEEWSMKLVDARQILDDARQAATDAEMMFRETICAAFAAGLSVTPIRDATGLTTSRLYQVKAGRRT